MPSRKPWSKTIEEHGVQVRIFERARGSLLYRSVITGTRTDHAGKPVTAKDIKSLKHRNKKLAEKQAKELATAIAQLQFTGPAPTGLTFGELRAFYLAHKPMTPVRKHFVERTLELFTRHLGAAFPMADFAATQVDSYLEARRSGRLRSIDSRAKANPRAGTLRNELQALRAVCAWAVEDYKRNGKPLLQFNPVPTKRIPKEANPVQPLMGADRFQKMAAVADTVEASGQLRLMLHVARHTARRINAICHLRRSDLCFGPDAVRWGAATIGKSEESVEGWTDAIVWRAEWDKKANAFISPMPAALKMELERYLARIPLIGDAWLFPYSKRPAEPTPKPMADYYFTKAEAEAKLPHLPRGRWHMLRRAWATSRKAMALADVMDAGGWRDAKALQKAYQKSDAAGVLQVMEAG